MALLQPSAVIWLQSRTFRGVPSGLLVSKRRDPRNPTTSTTVSAEGKDLIPESIETDVQENVSEGNESNNVAAAGFTIGG